MNRYDSTDFIFIGDNGNSIQTAQITNTAKAKGTVYQYGVHVPFIIAGPSVVNPGRKSDALINTADIFATVLDLFGDKTWQSQIPANKPVDSKSILPILKNTGVDIRPWSFCEDFKLTPDSTDGKAMRNKEYKLIRFDYGREEFYNLSNDPGELNNLLLGKLNAIEQTNYNELCTDMTKLIGKGSFCNSSADITNSITQKYDIYPNPFHAYIHSESFTEQDIYELTDCVGQSLFNGKNIKLQNFSNLPNGVYFLKISNKKNQTIKLLKE
jgi:arylsulfatase A-like enzyme